MRHLVAAALAVVFIGAAPLHAAEPELSAEQAARDLRILERAFNDLHPGLHRYATPAQLEAEFASAKQAVAQGASRAQMLLLASRIAAAVRCGHTWTNLYNQAPALRTALSARADKLPFTVRWVQGRVLVTASADAAVPRGAELLAIDGRTPAELAAALLPYLRADGASDNKRLAQLDSDANSPEIDRLFPLLLPPEQGRWRLRLRVGDGPVRELSVPAVTREARERAIGPARPDNAWRLSIDGDTALLTLPTFAFWDGRFDGRAFLQRSFAELAERRVPYLVIDIRRNEGGDDALGHALLAHLIRTPFTIPGGSRESAYERVPYNLVRFLDTWDYGFFDRTGQVTRGPGRSSERNWRLADAPPRRIEPVPAAIGPYAGRVLMLIGPENSSAAYLLARDVKAAGVAMLVGRPTGGNLRGLNGGQLTWLTLPASGVAVDIPLLAHFAPGNPPDAGVSPDILVPENFADAAAAIDSDMQAARALIARWRAGS
jgi:hypothetical protein